MIAKIGGGGNYISSIKKINYSIPFIKEYSKAININI